MWELEFEFDLNYIPAPKGRPRMTKRGIAFTPSKTRRAEQDLAVLVSNELKGKEPIDVAIRVEMDVFMPRPKSHYGTGRNAGKIKDSSPQFPITKPDIDNIEKLFLDAAEGLLWTNDSRIVHKNTRLCYADGRAPGYVVVVWKWRKYND